MLIGIHPAIGPDLLSILHRMGHGDEILLADAFFCGDTYGTKVIRADGIRIPDLLSGILTLITLDDMVDDPLVIMNPAQGDRLDPDMEKSYREAITTCWPTAPAFSRMERYAFYERVKKSFAVVMTGETVKYGNILIRKGVTSYDHTRTSHGSHRSGSGISG